jgi:hypothetical protein
MVALGGTASAFALDSLSFFFSAACMVPLLRIALPRPAGAGTRSPIGDLRDGLAEVTSRTWLWLSIAFFGLVNVLDAGPRNVPCPSWSMMNWADVGALGAVASSIAAGSVLAAVFLGRYHRLRRRGLLLYGCEIAMGAALIAIGILPSLPAVMAAAFVYGIGISTGSRVWVNSLQEMVRRNGWGGHQHRHVGPFIFLGRLLRRGILTERMAGQRLRPGRQSRGPPGVGCCSLSIRHLDESRVAWFRGLGLACWAPDGMYNPPSSRFFPQRCIDESRLRLPALLVLAATPACAQLSNPTAPTASPAALAATEAPLPVARTSDEPYVIRGSIPYTSPFFLDGIAEPYVLLEDESGFVNRDKEFVFPLESQAIGPVEIVEEGRLRYTASCPPLGTLDVPTAG